jgi:indole-3-glycerol phosphate synthase
MRHKTPSPTTIAPGVIATGTILDRILAHKQAEINGAQQRRPLAAVREAAERAAPPRDFMEALRAPGVSLIAEVKRASPSSGVLRPDLDPAAMARGYEAAGAAAVSVLTDTRFFQGSLADLRAVRDAVALPVLRKDFILAPYQIYEARAAGADAMLLIAAALENAMLQKLHTVATTLGMAALVEIHNRSELDRVLDALDVNSRSLLGINNRDLHTFDVDLATTAALRPHVPAGAVLVAESGVRTPADVTALAGLGVDAILVGTALVTAPDPGAKARSLIEAGLKQ